MQGGNESSPSPGEEVLHDECFTKLVSEELSEERPHSGEAAFISAFSKGDVCGGGLSECHQYLFSIAAGFPLCLVPLSFRLEITGCLIKTEKNLKQ